MADFVGLAMTGNMRNTLQARLITLMVISSIFLIAAFAAIQLQNQLKRSAESNLYRANMGALFTKDKLEKVFSKLDIAAPAPLLKNKIRDIFLSELQSKIIDNAVLLDAEGAALISEGEGIIDFKYDKLFLGEVYKARTRSKWLLPVMDKKNRVINFFIIPENPYGYFVQLTFSLGSMKEALDDVYGPVIFTVIIVVIANILLATLLSRALIAPVKVLNEATKDIAKGDLDRKVSIRTKDELEELAGTFNYMTVELKRMKARAENANPLTKLPGNIVIRDEVERRIKDNEKFMLIYCDLDNFKAFNDKYGVHSGDEVIVFTAKIFEDALSRNGTGKDFIGHEGGDDFLLLTLPEKVAAMTDFIIKEFDAGISKFYLEEDIKKGYIEAVSRDSDKTIKYPVMSISMVGVSNMKRKIVSYAQITNIAAELKKAAKRVKKSNFLIDRRVEDLGIDYRVERRGTIGERRKKEDE